MAPGPAAPGERRLTGLRARISRSLAEQNMGAAAASYVVLRRYVSRHHVAVKIPALAFYFCVGNLGTLLGLIDFFLGRKTAKWTPLKND